MGDDKCSVRPWGEKYPEKSCSIAALFTCGLPTICQRRWNRAKSVWKLWTATMERTLLFAALWWNTYLYIVPVCQCISLRSRRVEIAHGKTKTFAPFIEKLNAKQCCTAFPNRVFIIIPHCVPFLLSVWMPSFRFCSFPPFFSIYISGACFWNQGNQRERHGTKALVTEQNEKKNMRKWKIMK